MERAADGLVAEDDEGALLDFCRGGLFLRRLQLVALGEFGEEVWQQEICDARHVVAEHLHDAGAHEVNGEGRVRGGNRLPQGGWRDHVCGFGVFINAFK